MSNSRRVHSTSKTAPAGSPAAVGLRTASEWPRRRAHSGGAGSALAYGRHGGNLGARQGLRRREPVSWRREGMRSIRLMSSRTVVGSGRRCATRAVDVDQHEAEAARPQLAGAAARSPPGRCRSEHDDVALLERLAARPRACAICWHEAAGRRACRRRRRAGGRPRAARRASAAPRPSSAASVATHGDAASSARGGSAAASATTPSASRASVPSSMEDLGALAAGCEGKAHALTDGRR